MAEPLVRVQGVCKAYRMGDARAPALRDVSLTVGEAEFVGLAGPSGSGKSTLLNIVGALDEPDAGEVAWRGQTLDFRDRHRVEALRRQEFGFIFQQFNLAPVLTAQENVEMALVNHGLPAAVVADRARAALVAVGLELHRDKFPRQLSGGQQQRVAVARAIVKQPRLVLADEPSASLDGHNAQQLLELLQRLGRDHGTSFLVATHDQRLLQRLPRIVHMQDGEVVS